jgi:hypothetical protein
MSTVAGEQTGGGSVTIKFGNGNMATFTGLVSVHPAGEVALI